MPVEAFPCSLDHCVGVHNRGSSMPASDVVSTKDVAEVTIVALESMTQLHGR